MPELIPFLNEHLPETKFIIVGCDKYETNNDSLSNLNFIHYKDIDIYVRQ